MGSVGKAIGTVSSVMSPAGVFGAASGLGNALGNVGESLGNAVGGIFGGPKEADTSGLQGIQNAALGMYGEASKDYAAQADNRTAFAQQLSDRALGKAPSIAEAQMRQAQDRNLAQQVAAAKANRAVNPALAFRQVQRLGDQGAQQIAQQSGIMKLQEQQQNQGAYQNYLNNIQNQRYSALGAGSGAAQAQAAANVAQAQAQNQFMGNILGTAGTIGAAAIMSDKNQKKDIKPANSENSDKDENFSPKSFLDALQAYSYEYKNPDMPGAGEGRHLSVMAQDLEKAGPVGKSMVQNTPNGKIVDYGKGFGAILAAQADLNARLSEIESKYGPKNPKDGKKK